MQTATAVRTESSQPHELTSPATSVVSQLLTLASVRNLELCMAIRLARMQLPSNSPGITALVQEREVNDRAIALLEGMKRRVSAS